MIDHLYIAGAHSRSRTARVYLEYLEADTKVSAFLVSPEMTDNPGEVDGVPVICIPAEPEITDGDYVPVLDTSLPVYLGTRGVNHEKLTRELRAVGFTDIRPITMELDIALRNAYLEKWHAAQGRSFVRMDMLQEPNVAGSGSEGKTAAVYVASSIYDGTPEDPYTPIPEERILQVGAALTDQRLGDGCTVDCEGENISERNKQFCELTGLYWIWKHATEDYVGLVHYRRHFLLPNRWIEICEREKIDVVLPVPLYVGPSVRENYRERHVASDWDYVEAYFAEFLPEEYGNFLEIMGGNLYCPCNMLIARREVLNELCTWLFPILFAAAEHGGAREDKYQNRFPGFLSERLITYFFESRRERYKVVYCNKNFLR